MSSLVIDLIIWILLVVGVGFGLIGLIGLLIFPDTRSRMYTAVRATMISISSVGLAVITYGLYTLQTSGGSPYVTLLLHAFILVVVVALGNYVVYSTIFEKTYLAVRKTPYPEKKRNGEDEK
ncbi:MAG: monovalent cation/H(+) antiporter subunit G [Methanoregula sp.]|jgi:multicomponent Na+:H+ antiporter subunit G